VDELLDNFLNSVETTAGNILPVVERVLGSIFETLAENGPEMIVSGVKLLGKLAVGVVNAIPDLVAKIPEVVMSIVDAFAESGPEFKEIGAAIVQGIWTGIQNLGSWLWGKVSGFFGDIVDGVKDKLGIHSPSRVFAGIGENMALGLGEGWQNEYGAVKSGITDGLSFASASIPFASSGLGASAASIINSVSNTGDHAGGPLSINLVLPDGTAFARYFLPSFIDVARSDGTPILNPL
jgi:phage-related protein